MKQKFTPGPWKIRDEKADWYDSGACFDIDTADGNHIGFVTRSTIGISGEESLANARLFAASPKMLAALKKTEAYLQGLKSGKAFEESDLVGVIKDAIQEAEGE